MRRDLVAATATALAVGGYAPVEQRHQLAEPVGLVMTAPVGASIATITKDRDLPNAFGRADVYDRKVDAGFLKIIYRGRGSDGSVLLEQIDVEVRSNASTMTRRPVVHSGTQPAVASSREKGVAYGTSRAISLASPAEQQSVLPPNAAQFAVPKETSLRLPTGQSIEFLAAEPHQVTCRIVDQAM